VDAGGRTPFLFLNYFQMDEKRPVLADWYRRDESKGETVI
jgi:hypothetical protein